MYSTSLIDLYYAVAVIPLWVQWCLDFWQLYLSLCDTIGGAALSLDGNEHISHILCPQHSNVHDNKKLNYIIKITFLLAVFSHPHLMLQRYFQFTKTGLDMNEEMWQDHQIYWSSGPLPRRKVNLYPCLFNWNCV